MTRRAFVKKMTEAREDTEEKAAMQIKNWCFKAVSAAERAHRFSVIPMKETPQADP